VTGPDCKEGGWKSPSWRAWCALLVSICASRGVGLHVVMQENDPFSERPEPPLFFLNIYIYIYILTSKDYSAFHNKPLTLLWSLVPWILSTKFPYSPSIRTSAGGSSDGSVHVLSLFTPTLRSKNVWGYAYSKNRSYLLLLSMRFDAVTTRLFLPTNRTLILEWPTYMKVHYGDSCLSQGRVYEWV